MHQVFDIFNTALPRTQKNMDCPIQEFFIVKCEKCNHKGIMFSGWWVLEKMEMKKLKTHAFKTMCICIAPGGSRYLQKDADYRVKMLFLNKPTRQGSFWDQQWETPDVPLPASVPPVVMSKTKSKSKTLHSLTSSFNKHLLCMSHSALWAPLALYLRDPLEWSLSTKSETPINPHLW